MMSLLGFAWMVASWMTFLGENRVRISASARQKVWELAHHITPSDPNASFYNSGGFSESSNDNEHNITPPPVTGTQPIDFNSLLTLNGDLYRVHEKEVIINILEGNTGKFFDKPLPGELPFMEGNDYKPTVIGDPNAAWVDMYDYLEDRDEIMTWIQSGS